MLQQYRFVGLLKTVFENTFPLLFSGKMIGHCVEVRKSAWQTKSIEDRKYAHDSPNTHSVWTGKRGRSSIGTMESSYGARVPTVAIQSSYKHF